MPDYQDQVAVITGGASGIGLALAKRLGASGARLMLADIEEPALLAAVADLADDGIEVRSQVCDVSDRDSVDALADAAFSAFGAVHFLANNAGVVARHDAWGSLDDWDWVLGIDLMGVVYGVHSFIPRMLESGQSGHVMNTASTAGLLAFPNISSYNVAKRGVVALSESLFHELAGTPLSVSCLCPGIVATRIGFSERNRPTGGEPRVVEERAVGDGAAEEMSPDELAKFVLDEIARGTFWLLPHEHYGHQALEQAQRRIDRGTPVLPRINR